MNEHERTRIAIHSPAGHDRGRGADRRDRRDAVPADQPDAQRSGGAARKGHRRQADQPRQRGGTDLSLRRGAREQPVHPETGPRRAEARCPARLGAVSLRRPDDLAAGRLDLLRQHTGRCDVPDAGPRPNRARHRQGRRERPGRGLCRGRRRQPHRRTPAHHALRPARASVVDRRCRSADGTLDRCLLLVRRPGRRRGDGRRVYPAHPRPERDLIGVLVIDVTLSALSEFLRGSKPRSPATSPSSTSTTCWSRRPQDR